jgi:outer membrane lipoprotein-sorting protein
MNTKKLCLISFLFLLSAGMISAQTARQVLDKTSTVLSARTGASANFTISGNKYGNVSGTISIKGKKFHAVTPQAIVWFNGKTEWTYMKKNDEVNVNTPNEAQLQKINPYNFINMYRNGYNYSMTSSGGKYVVHLTSDAKRAVPEMYITVDKSTYQPTQVRMRQDKAWTTINISNFRNKNISDGMFTFNSKDFPNAEVIDLR